MAAGLRAVQGAPRLTHAAVTAVTSFAIDATLQNMVRSWRFAAIRGLRAQPNATIRWVVRLVARSFARWLGCLGGLAQLVDVGTLWHILPPLFKYDYTLAEGGVQASTETNRQEVRACPKRAARMSLH